MTPKSRVALGIAAGAAALILLSLYLWPALKPEPTVENYHTMERTLIFDFNSTEGETQSLTLDLDLGPAEVERMDKAQVFVRMKHKELSRYPDSVSGSLTCEILTFINGKQWFRGFITYDYQATDPAAWSGSHDEVWGGSLEAHYPDTYEKADATDHFHRSGTNHIQSTVACTSQVDSTGPTLGLLEFGPLTALITS